jgi:hypothetical protein
MFEPEWEASDGRPLFCRHFIGGKSPVVVLGSGVTMTWHNEDIGSERLTV